MESFGMLTIVTLLSGWDISCTKANKLKPYKKNSFTDQIYLIGNVFLNDYIRVVTHMLKIERYLAWKINLVVLCKKW